MRWSIRGVPGIGFALSWLVASGPELPAQQQFSLGSCSHPPGAPGIEVERRSLYVPAADGVRLAVDLYLPKKLAGKTKLPAVFAATREWRARRDDPIGTEERFWLERGFAYVKADVRGTGASFGTWDLPWTPREVKDVKYLANWIAEQRWSNGQVGTIGTGYLGNTALLAAGYGSPAVKAVVSRFAEFDLYTDLFFPGGVVAERPITRWGRWLRALDLNEGDEALGPGIRPVDRDRGDGLLRAAIAEHRQAQSSFDRLASLVTYKDDVLQAHGGFAIDVSGVRRYQVEIESTNVPIFGWASWFDAATAHGALERFAWKNPQVVVIGPWTHAARHDADPFAPPDRVADPSPERQEEQAACFFTRHLTEKPDGRPERTIFYYTIGENEWKKTEAWPVPGTRTERFYFHEGRQLVTSSPAWAARDMYRVDFTATTGVRNRWHARVDGGDVVYPDRVTMDQRLLHYTSAPLVRDLEVTGHPVVTLGIMSTASDGNFFLYLEDVAPDGTVTYVTEGMLRALHRKISKRPIGDPAAYPARTFARQDGEQLLSSRVVVLTFHLLPTSVLFRAGHRIRVALAGADRDTFARVPAEGEVTLTVARGGPTASFIDLPVVPRS